MLKSSATDPEKDKNASAIKQLIFWPVSATAMSSAILKFFGVSFMNSSTLSIGSPENT
jgi:hypothetical protein